MKSINNYILESIFDIDDESIINKRTEDFDISIEPEDEKQFEKLGITIEDCYSLGRFIMDSCNNDKLKGNEFKFYVRPNLDIITVEMNEKMKFSLKIDFIGNGRVMYVSWGVPQDEIYDRLTRGKKEKWLLKFTRHKKITA